MLRQRPHDRRPEQPKFGLEKLWGEELLDAPPVPPILGRHAQPREGEAVAPTQAVTRAMHGAQGAVDDMHLVDERMLLIESEELLFDGNVGVRFGGDRREQVKSAAEFLVKHGAGQVVAARGASVQEEPAAELVVRLVDRNVLARHVSVPDEQRGRRQSTEPAANDMRLHPPPPRTSGLTRESRQHNRTDRRLRNSLHFSLRPGNLPHNRTVEA